MQSSESFRISSRAAALRFGRLTTVEVSFSRIHIKKRKPTRITFSNVSKITALNNRSINYFCAPILTAMHKLSL